jgi:hypothetical protein
MTVKLYARLEDLERARAEGDATIFVCTEKPFGNWVEIAHPQQPARVPLSDDPWHKLYRRAINEANGLTNYVEDRPELRSAERRLTAIEAEARTLAAAGIVPAPTTDKPGYKITVVDDAHPNGIPYEQWVNPK